MRGIDPILTAITGHASAYAALLWIMGTRLASYGWEILAGIGEETRIVSRLTGSRPAGFACAPLSAAAILI